MDDLGIWFGFIGIIVGALITFAADYFISKKRMKFDISVELRKSLMDMNKELVEWHSNIQQFYDENRDNTYKEYILELKPYHLKVMELYKDFRIHFGDLYAYELQSAIYNVYYEKCKLPKSTIKDYQYFIAYQALKDAYGLMINEVRFGLLTINSLKRINWKMKTKKNSEYIKYADRINHSMTKDLSSEISQYEEVINPTPFDKALGIVKVRIKPFKEEVKQISRRIFG